jgi:hypothetical protein
MPRQLHESDQVDCAAEVTVGIEEIQDLRITISCTTAMPDEDLELRPGRRVEVMNLRRPEGRPLVVHRPSMP